MVKANKKRSTGLQVKLASVAAALEPFFTSSQLADIAIVSRDQASKMCNFWARKGLVKVVGNVRLEHRKQPIFVYAKTSEFGAMLLAVKPAVVQKNLFEMEVLPETEEPADKISKPEPSKVIPLKPRADFMQRIDDFIEALDILRDASLNLKEGA
jgi:hypothetical protein